MVLKKTVTRDSFYGPYGASRDGEILLGLYNTTFNLKTIRYEKGARYIDDKENKMLFSKLIKKYESDIPTVMKKAHTDQNKELNWLQKNTEHISTLSNKKLAKMIDILQKYESVLSEDLWAIGDLSRVCKDKEIVTKLIYFRTKFQLLRKKDRPYENKMLKEISNRIGIDYSINLLTVSEIRTALLENKLPLKKEVLKRKNLFSLTMTKDKEIFSFEVSKNKKLNVNSFKGNTACLGIVSGKVRVILRHSDLQNIKKGEILVTPMTTVEFVPFISKISGIITDEGGITCHAGIMSREHNKPCVVGTSIATKALKTGDKVVLNADSGTIKIIKKVN